MKVIIGDSKSGGISGALYGKSLKLYQGLEAEINSGGSDVKKELFGEVIEMYRGALKLYETDKSKLHNAVECIDGISEILLGTDSNA